MNYRVKNNIILLISLLIAPSIVEKIVFEQEIGTKIVLFILLEIIFIIFIISFTSIIKSKNSLLLSFFVLSTLVLACFSLSAFLFMYVFYEKNIYPLFFTTIVLFIMFVAFLSKSIKGRFCGQNIGDDENTGDGSVC